MSTFLDTGLREDLLTAVQELGFEEPTPIQEKTIPFVLDSKQDLIALAQTGTGKTAAFGLPLLQMVDTDSEATQVLILCPTRELCIQIATDLKSFAKYIPDLHILAVYGGSSIGQQIKALKRGAHVVVGTPGRTKDLLHRGKLHLDTLERVVLDEADEMLRMGFKEEVNAILADTPKDKQTLLFSATMSQAMSGITRQYMHQPAELSVAARNVGNSKVAHHFYVVQSRDKYEALKRIVDMNPDFYGIVFCRTRRDSKEIAQKLIQDGYPAEALHGDLSQEQRDEVMQKFRVKQIQILAATDVVSRGLDVEELTHVINLNLPDEPEVYVHRSGRTGRAGKAGVSVAIITKRQGRKLQEIERHAQIRFHRQQVPNAQAIQEKQLWNFVTKVDQTPVDEAQIAPLLDTVYAQFEHLSKEELIQKMISAELSRTLSYYDGARDLNSSYEPEKKREQRGNLVTLKFNLGKAHDIHPAWLITLVNETLDSKEAKIGQISILKRHSFFEIDQWAVEPLIEALNESRLLGERINIQVTEERMPQSRGRRPRPYKGGKSSSYKGNFRKHKKGGKKSFRKSR